MTSLHISVGCGGKKLVRILFEELEEQEHDQAERLRLVNLHVEKYGTPLHQASVREQADMIELLVAHGANVNEPSCHQDILPVLHEAVFENRLAVVASLAGLGANLNAETPDSEMCMRAITLAVLPNVDIKILELLINRGADIDYTTWNGRTILFTAIEYHSLPKVKLLISAGADVNWGEGLQRTPLTEAVGTKNLGLVAYFLEAGANIDGRDECGFTALFVAAGRGYEAIAQTLIGAGAAIDAAIHGEIHPVCGTQSEGITPLCMAKSQCHDGMVKLLTGAGADQAILKRLRVMTTDSGKKIPYLVSPDDEESPGPHDNQGGWCCSFLGAIGR